MSDRRFRKFIVCLISIICSCYLSIYIRFGSLYRNWQDMFKSVDVFLGLKISNILIYLICSFLVVFIFYPFKVNSHQRSFLRHFKDSLLINLFTIMIFTFVLYILNVSTNISRKFTIYFFIIDTILMFIGFRVFRSMHDRYQVLHKRRTVVFTTGNHAKSMINNLRKYGPKDIQMDAVIIIDKSKFKIYKLYFSRNDVKLDYLPDTDYIDYLKKEVVDVAYISLPEQKYSDTINTIRLLDSMGINSYLSLSNFDIEDIQSRMVKSGMLNVLEYAPRFFSKDELFAKRLMDIIGAIIGCALCCIIGIIVAPLIYLEDHGPVIFKQKRVGKNGRYFYMYKFRSMYTDAEERKKDLINQNEMKGFMFKMENDPRITKVGKFLRKTSLDEFPQFFNVLKGDMSLVGTRPPTVDEFQMYDAHHKKRLALKPGITGMWQVSGRSNITDFEEIVRLDTYYIENWTISLDIKILLMTIVSVFKAEGSE